MRLSLLIFLTARALAATDWVHVVGIDENNPEQNSQEFYDSALAFEQSCRTSDQHPQCELHMNINPQLSKAVVPRPVDLPDLNKDETLSPKQAIADRIAQAKQGDTLILSMQNHGAPAGKSPACVWFSSHDKMCTQDLEQMLKKKPPGVKILISAHACFGGGFVELSHKDVCVVASAEKLQLGLVATPSLWNSVDVRHIKTLSDLAEPIFKDSNQLLLGSQMILGELCKSARARLPGGAASPLTSSLALVSDYHFEDDCHDGYLSSRKLQEVAFAMQAVTQKLTARSCAELQLPQSVCAARARLQRAGPELASALQQLKTLDEFQARLESGEEVQKEAFIAVGDRLYRLPKPEQAELTQSLVTGKDPRLNRLSEPAKKIWQDMAPIRAFRNDKVNSQLKKNALVQSIQKKGLWDDLLTLQSCLSENTFDATLSAEDRIDQAKADRLIKKLPARHFTETDYEEARACERSLHF